MADFNLPEFFKNRGDGIAGAGFSGRAGDTDDLWLHFFDFDSSQSSEIPEDC